MYFLKLKSVYQDSLDGEESFNRNYDSHLFVVIIVIARCFMNACVSQWQHRLGPIPVKPSHTVQCRGGGVA